MTRMDRRRFLGRAVAAGAAAAGLPVGGFGQGRAEGFTDVNVDLFRWPFRRLPGDEVEALVAKLREFGVREAWAASFEGIFQRDLAAVNRRLAEACRGPGREMLRPFGSVNPVLPGWEEALRRCDEEHGMRGIRLHPNYHGYGLEEVRFAKLLAMAAERGLVVQVAASMEDVRTQHPSARVEDVDLAPLPAVIEGVPGARVVVLNYKPRGSELAKFAGAPRIWFDIARVEDTAGVARLVDTVGAERVLFGSHAPFFIFEAALIKVHEADLPESEREFLFAGNARKLMGGTASSPGPGVAAPSGLPPRSVLDSYAIWDSYFTAFDAGPDSGRLLEAIERTLPTIEKGRFRKLCLFPQVGTGTADAVTEERLRSKPESILAPFVRWPGKFLGMIQLNANDVRASLEALDRWLRDGPMVGVYFPGSGPGALPCNHANYDPLVERIAELGGAIMQHNWEITGGKTHPGMSTPAELAELAARHPEQIFICAHAGGNWEKGIRAVRDCPNVMVETSGFDPTAGFIEMAVRELGAERIVFGSHLPSRSLGTELGKVVGAKVSEEAKRKILGANLRGLVG